MVKNVEANNSKSIKVESKLNDDSSHLKVQFEYSEQGKSFQEIMEDILKLSLSKDV